MAADISDRVRQIAEARGVAESDVFEAALERGIEEMWEDVVIGRYFDDDLSRDEAMELVGRQKVVQAEMEREAVEEDVDWGMGA